MTTPFNPELHVFHRAQVGAQTPLPPAPAGRELVNVWRVLDELEFFPSALSSCS